MPTNKTKNFFRVPAEDFKKIPGSPIAYWASDELFTIFLKLPTVKEFAFAGIGMRTGDNERFLRHWFEVSFLNILLDCSSVQCQIQMQRKWIPYNKGGSFRKWYGNNDYVVNWLNDGYEIKENTRRIYPQLGDNLGWKISNEQYYYKPGITWSGVGQSDFGCRCYKNGFIFDSGANGLFVYDEKDHYFFAGCLNSNVVNHILKILNPTVNTGSGTINQVPIPKFMLKKSAVSLLVKNNLIISMEDWNSHETSWDFQNNPLIDAQKRCKGKGKIHSAYLQLRDEWRRSSEEMRRLEVENNRIFIEAYGLQDELSPEVPWDEITLTCNPWYRYGKSPKADSRDGKEWLESTSDLPISDNWGIEHGGRIIVMPPVVKMKSCFMPFNQILEIRLLQDTIKELFSYAVGCMFGRYSLDVQGLAYAGGEWDASKYTTFPADPDNIIPICDDEYFKDDLIGRFVKFIETVFGRESLEDNLNFIANALGGRGTAREVIRRYFCNDFFADHCKMYQKRPIYWLFDSGKKGGFRALIYMHRYQPSTLATLRTDYVHEQQDRYRTAIADLASRVDNARGSEKVKLSKQLAQLREQAEETRIYEEKIHHLADQMISIDLDDGVKHNYAIFQDVLAKIK